MALRRESIDMGGRAPSEKDPPEPSGAETILGVEVPLWGGVLRPSLAVDCSRRSCTVIRTLSTACTGLQAHLVTSRRVDL